MKRGLMFLSLIFAMTISPVQNVSVYGYNAILQSNSEMAMAPRADVIVEKLRINNGVLQYRRWNQTRGYWVDPDWINCS